MFGYRKKILRAEYGPRLRTPVDKNETGRHPGRHYMFTVVIVAIVVLSYIAYTTQLQAGN